jgi:hypothetical protein
MIVRPLPDGILCIRQRDHAALAGALAEAWGGGFPELRPRGAVALAIRRHDDGWRERDEAPVLDPTSGMPFTYRAIPLADALDVAERSVARVGAVDPYAGWLVSRHFASFHADSETPEARTWVTAQVGHRAELLSRAWPRVGREALHPHVLEGNLDVLQLLDGLSLALCEDWPAWESRETSAAYGEETTMFHYRRLESDGRTVRGRVSPWPFAAAEVRSAVPARKLPAGPWRGDAALVAAWERAEPRALEVALARA